MLPPLQIAAIAFFTCGAELYYGMTFCFTVAMFLVLIMPMVAPRS